VRNQPDATADDAAVERFLAAGQIDRDTWHDGIGYPLEALGTLNAASGELLVSRLPVKGWREVEVLAALATASARSSLRAGFDAAGQARLEIGLALLRWLPELLSEAERTDLVCRAIEQARGGDGLDSALEAAQAWHPAAVMTALWQSLHQPDTAVVVNSAALLYYLLGLTDTPFDLSRRTDFLRFASDDADERTAALDQLRMHMGFNQAYERPHE
jgi:hypothetical protein